MSDDLWLIQGQWYFSVQFLDWDETVMLYILWTFMSFCAYVSGLVILVKVTPLLLTRTYDEGYFMAIAAADVLGGMFVFAAVAITFGLFSGMFVIRLIDCFLLLGIAIIAFNLSYRCIRSRRAVKAHPVSRVIASGYSLFLGLAALFYLVLLFVPGG